MYKVKDKNRNDAFNIIVVLMCIALIFLTLSACSSKTTENNLNSIDSNEYKNDDTQNNANTSYNNEIKIGESFFYYLDNQYCNENKQVDISNTNISKMDIRFKTALFPQYGTVVQPSYNIYNMEEHTFGEQPNTISHKFAVMNKDPFYTNYIIYTVDTERDMIEATDYNLQGTPIFDYSYLIDLITNTLQDYGIDTDIEDCYLGCKVQIRGNSFYPILYITQGDSGIMLSKLLAFTDGSEIYKVESGLDEYNNTNMPVGDIMKHSDERGFTLEYNEDNAEFYLSKLNTVMGISNSGEYPIILDPTYPWRGGSLAEMKAICG